MFSGLSWTFPLSETADFVQSNMAMIMPLLVLILGVLLALLLIDGITASLLKIIAFVVSTPTASIDIGDGLTVTGSRHNRSRQRSAIAAASTDPTTEETDDSEFD